VDLPSRAGQGGRRWPDGLHQDLGIACGHLIIVGCWHSLMVPGKRVHKSW
jgi:hypothetical protein